MTVKVAVLAIASGGEAYDSMKLVTQEHLRAASSAGLDVSTQFVYGTPCTTQTPTDLDVVYDVRESLIPGILQKTQKALAEALAASPDFIIRTNASTWFHWDKLAAWLSTAPRTGLAAGYAPDQSHLCGCCIVLTPDVAARLAEYPRYEHAIDDLAIAAALRDLKVDFTWIPRIDILEQGIVGHGTYVGLDPRDAFQVRVKGCLGADGPRMRDPLIMANLTAAYKRGVRDIDELLKESVKGVETIV